MALRKVNGRSHASSNNSSENPDVHHHGSPDSKSRARKPSFLFYIITRSSRVLYIVTTAAMLVLLLIYLSLSLSPSPVLSQSLTTSSPVPSGTAIDGNYDGILRPQIHFSPPVGFMNDPNGMFVDASGTYHLYYQYNPTDTIAGNQHWGHATSLDLYHWTNQPIALFPHNNVTGIFSGSAGIDVNNTSGFFPEQSNGVVMIYTAHGPDDQNQALAYSFDDGYTFTQYSGNPVLAIGSTNFRDPKVIWHSSTERWVMVVAYAQEYSIGIFTSLDLISWSHASNFSFAGYLGLQYECPNMVSMPYLDRNGSLIEDMYLMYISINPGAPQGGSVGEYFPGHFNGTHFTPVDGAARIADFGKDNYASQFWYEDDESGADVGGRKSVAWASNWQYTNSVPSGPREGWQSAMTVGRRNWLEKRGRLGWSLMSLPVDLGPVLRERILDQGYVGNETVTATAAGGSGAMLISVNVSDLVAVESKASVNFTVSSSMTGEKLQGGQFFSGDFWLDRGGSGWGSDNVFFTDKVSVSLEVGDSYELMVLVDRGVIEVFLDGGVRSGTQTYFSDGVMDRVSVSCGGLGGDARVNVVVWELKSTWAGRVQ